ncbi:MAG: phosphoglucosamine mutase [Polyangiales bacterium]
MNERKLFGTDGIRGLANAGHMTPEIAFRIGAAITFYAKTHATHVPRVLIGKDTRLSGYLFETALSSGVCAMGGRVTLCGPLPTPAIAHLAMSMRADMGVVISASHNPYQDNGIKIFGADGFKLPDSVEAELETLVFGDKIDRSRPTKTGVGRAERLDDASGRYVAFVKSSFPQDLTLDGVRIVVDAANGAAYKTAPLVFSELGASTHAIGCKPDGKNINHRVGALHPEACASEVKKRKADMGIALDGDADRVIVVDENGDVVNGDTLMALCATEMIRERLLNKNTLVATVMSNIGLEIAMKRAGGKLLRTDVGDRYVVETMRERNLNFGGEQSGHLIFLDHATTGDGLIAAMQVLSIMKKKDQPLSELAKSAMDHFPQVLLNATFPKKRSLSALPKTQSLIKQTEAKLGADGRVLVRWSGTEPKLRVMIEGENEKTIVAMAERIVDQAKKEYA